MQWYLSPLVFAFSLDTLASPSSLCLDDKKRPDHESSSAFSVGGRDCSVPLDSDTDEELLNVRDVLELLRNFLRAKALTESEIRREVCYVRAASASRLATTYVIFFRGFRVVKAVRGGVKKVIQSFLFCVFLCHVPIV